MNHFKNIYSSLLIATMTSCSLGIKTSITTKYPPLDSLKEVRVYDVKEIVPVGAVEIGAVSIYDNMTMKCDSAIVYSAAKNEARKAGGNILKVTEHLYPSFASSCHRIQGKIMKLDDLNDSLMISPLEKSATVQPIIKHDSRFAINGGLSWQTSKISDELNEFEKDYLRELKSGFHYGGEFNYFVNQTTGIGIMVNVFHSSYSVYASGQTTNGTTVSGTLSDNINIVYVGPNITWRLLSPTQLNAFLVGLSIGYLHYNNQAHFTESSELSGGTVGVSYDLSYDWGISKSTALGIGFSWKIGMLSSLDVTQNGSTKTYKLEDDQRLGLGHLDLSIGLRFR